MPGIVGFASKYNQITDSEMLNKMLSDIYTEKFYQTGKYSEPSIGLNCGFGLLSTSGHENYCCDPAVVLLLSGECFLSKDGKRIISNTRDQGGIINIKTLIQLYKKAGKEVFLKSLNGLYCGLLIDKPKKKAFLFNDRYGMQRVYYTIDENVFAFSSQVKPLFNIMQHACTMDMQSLSETIVCGGALEGKSLFKNINLLPPGSCWEISHGNQIMRGKYFDFKEYETQEPLQYADYHACLKKELEERIPIYFANDQKTAFSITGGIDTRILMAVQKPLINSLPCYSFGGMYRECYDVKIGRKLAEEYGQTHQVLTLGVDYLNNFLKLIKETILISEGTIDISASYELYLNRAARMVAPIRITGNFGGELLRNVGAFKSYSPYWRMFSGGFKEYLNEGILRHAAIVNKNDLTSLLTQRIPWQMNGRYALERSQVSVCTPFLDNEIVARAYRKPSEKFNGINQNMRLIYEYDQRLAKMPTDKGYAYLRPKSFTSMFRKFNVNTEYVYNYGMPQWMAKIDYYLQFIHLERVFMGWHKFHHFRIWYRDQLSSFIKEILLDKRTLGRDYLEAKEVERLVVDHTKGSGNYTTQIHQLLTLELMQRLLIEKSM